MSTSVETPIPTLKQPDPTSWELDSKDTVGQTVTPLRKRSSAHAGFCAKSYNSAFLEDLFGDVASTGPEDKVGSKPEESSVYEPTTEEDSTLSVAVASDHNLSKRRRVSTNKSLGRSGKSHANLTSFASIRCKQSSPVLALEAATRVVLKKDLPATVSASYSFTQDPASGEQAVLEEGSNKKDEEGDFGWFVDTDDQPVYETASTSTNACDVPLTFTAATAPTKDYQAEVEWAQAADTVDEVLGDFF